MKKVGQPASQSNVQNARSLLILGFRDYIAGRFLINAGYIVQGATLSTTAVEKYLKAILIFYGIVKEVHMDKWHEIKNHLHKIDPFIFKNTDESFFKILGTVYKLRYYNQIRGNVFYGFLTHQFLAELDALIHQIESKFTYATTDGSEAPKSSYFQAVEARNADLLENNYLLLGLDKKQFMETPCTLFSLFVNKYKTEITMEGKEQRTLLYSGKMFKPTDFRIV